MPIIQPSLSQQLTEELQRASSFQQVVMNAFPHTFAPASNRVQLLASKTHLADDLYGSIIFLLHAGGPYDGGAFALIRPLVEVSVEAQWQFFCASDATFEKAYAGQDVDPGLPNMMDALDAHIGDTLFARLRSNVKTLHGFTHGGNEQLTRRFDAEGNLRANYSDADKVKAIHVSASVYCLLSSIFCQAAYTGDGKSPASHAIEMKYADLYVAGN